MHQSPNRDQGSGQGQGARGTYRAIGSSASGMQPAWPRSSHAKKRVPRSKAQTDSHQSLYEKNQAAHVKKTSDGGRVSVSDTWSGQLQKELGGIVKKIKAFL